MATYRIPEVHLWGVDPNLRSSQDLDLFQATAFGLRHESANEGSKQGRQSVRGSRSCLKKKGPMCLRNVSFEEPLLSTFDLVTFLLERSLCVSRYQVRNNDRRVW